MGGKTRVRSRWVARPLHGLRHHVLIEVSISRIFSVALPRYKFGNRTPCPWTSLLFGTITLWIVIQSRAEFAVRCRTQRFGVIHVLVRGPSCTTATGLRNDRILKSQTLAPFHGRPNKSVMGLEYSPRIRHTWKVFPNSLATPLPDPVDPAALIANGKHDLAHFVCVSVRWKNLGIRLLRNAKRIRAV